MPMPDPTPVLELLADLLGTNGCRWDKSQTPASLCDHLLGETYELVEAIRGGHPAAIQEEMGDVFFLLFFMATLLQQEHGLDLDAVWQQCVRKMKRRHPHVFGTETVHSQTELHQKWEAVKKQEKIDKHQKARPENLFDSIPSILPPLLQAYQLNSKAAKDGFTWHSRADQEQALQDEWQEWQRIRDDTDAEAREEEFGDLLFSLVEQGRRHGVKANAALQRANLKFSRRFRRMCLLAEKKGLDWEALDLEAKDRLWDAVKQEEQEEENGECGARNAEGGM